MASRVGGTGLEMPNLPASETAPVCHCGIVGACTFMCLYIVCRVNIWRNHAWAFLVWGLAVRGDCAVGGGMCAAFATAPSRKSISVICA